MSVTNNRRLQLQPRLQLKGWKHLTLVESWYDKGSESGPHTVVVLFIKTRGCHKVRDKTLTPDSGLFWGSRIGLYLRSPNRQNKLLSDVKNLSRTLCHPRVFINNTTTVCGRDSLPLLYHYSTSVKYFYPFSCSWGCGSLLSLLFKCDVSGSFPPCLVPIKVMFSVLIFLWDYW